MATYKKALLTVEVITTCGESYTAADTTEKALGSAVFSAFKDKQTLAIVTSDTETVYVPFHAVCAVKVKKSTEDVEKPNPYNCEPENCEETPEP